jgi:PhoPQ-activated pathogenicity-related protein
MPATNELFHYVSQSDPAYSWSYLDAREEAGVTVVRLSLRSQVWQGIPWKHTLELYIPPQLRDFSLASLTIETPPAARQMDVGVALALETGVVCAFLSDMPNQPLFDDLIEDALIAHTFVQYLDTGDATWPLLFPMVKSVARAMDAIAAYGADAGGFTGRRFVISGASKRGWTTWLTAAVDPRVAGIIPMVYDNLNLAAQMPHQVETFEGYSEQISDYTDLNLPQRMQTPEGQRLAQMVDPYTYRDRFTMPKLIINGANDRYWATDAINLYWDALPGMKHLLDIPNAGHSLQDPQRLLSTVAAFLRGVADQNPLPRLDWAYDTHDRAVTLSLAADEPSGAARLWVAYAAGRDFRASPWMQVAMAAEEAASPGLSLYSGTVERPENGYMALYGEIEFMRHGNAFTLTIPVHIAAARLMVKD